MDRLPPTASATHRTMQVACRIALRFPRGVPTAGELQQAFGMNRATAYRWVAAMRAVRGEQIDKLQDQHKGNENG